MNKQEKLILQYPIPWKGSKIIKFRNDVLSWYDLNQRLLPWRMTSDPYKIWVSEIMLQQTQVDTVIPYYERFISELPTISALAEAPESNLLSLWQGLGYYSRVRNMQVAAKTLVEDFGGDMPNNVEDLLKLKGIGPYTAGAIASIAFKLPEPAVDGNLIRITSRLFNLQDDISKQASLNKIHAYLYQLIDPDRPGDFNQALMDIGATIMTATNPYPENHPLIDYDAAYSSKTAHLLPIKTKKVKNTPHYYFAFAIHSQDGKYLLRRHTEKELLTGLWHFPLIECQMIMESATEQEIVEQFYLKFGREIASVNPENRNITHPMKLTFDVAEIESTFPLVKHIFSHRTWFTQLIPLEVKLLSDQIILPQGYQWINDSDIDSIAISTLQSKLWQLLYPIC